MYLHLQCRSRICRPDLAGGYLLSPRFQTLTFNNWVLLLHVLNCGLTVQRRVFNQTMLTLEIDEFREAEVLMRIDPGIAL